MNNRLISCPSWLPKQGRQVLLVSVLCLLILGLSAFSFAPSAHAASVASSAQAASGQARGASSSTSRLSFTQETLPTTGAITWTRWSKDGGVCALVGCWVWKLTIHGDGVRNSSIHQIWQWNVYCTWGGIAKLTACYYSGNGTSVITLVVQGKTAFVSHGALLSINYNGIVVRYSTW